MSEAEVAKIAQTSDMIVGGYAMMKHEFGIRIFNLHSRHALIVSPDYKMLETNMDDLEAAVAIDYLKTNRSFMEA